MNSLAVLAATLLSLGLASSASAQLRVGPNYRLNDDPSAFRAVDQIGLAVHRTNPQHVVAVNANYLDLRCEASRSLDGGVTWSTAVPLVPPAAAALNARCEFHQSVEFGTGLNVYAIVTANKTNTSSPDASVVVYKSTDGGLTWAPGVRRHGRWRGNQRSRPVAVDRPELHAAGPGGRARSGNGRRRPHLRRRARLHRDRQRLPRPLTRVRRRPGRGVQRRRCDLHAEGQRQRVGRRRGRSGSGRASTPTARSPSRGARPGITGILQASRTTDQGTTWSAPANIATVTNTGTSTATHVPPTPPATTGASTTASYPRMASDPNIAGRVYIVYGQGHRRPRRRASGAPITSSTPKRGLVPALVGLRRDVDGTEADQRPDDGARAA